jgi:anti-sigma regulatory factor (Ser/Thr protein kinase)
MTAARREQCFPVRAPVDALVAGGVARRFAASGGADRRFSATFAIVVAELASNIVHHAEGGVVRLTHDHRTFIIEAIDRGMDHARVGRRGLGIGQGAIARLSDRVDVHPLANGGRSVRVEMTPAERTT